MGKKIILSEEQRDKLSDLWFIFGNNGKKCNHGNHKFIQNILEHGEDNREFYKSSRIAGYEVTDECIKEVDNILKQ